MTDAERRELHALLEFAHTVHVAHPNPEKDAARGCYMCEALLALGITDTTPFTLEALREGFATQVREREAHLMQYGEDGQK